MVHISSIALLAFAISVVQSAAPPATQRANGAAAAALNVKFATLTAASPCTAGEQACVQGSFGQCVGGKFALTACAGGTTCQALPLLNKAGTSITCDTAADAAARIAAAKAARRSIKRRAAPAATQHANGAAAAALNVKFAKLTAASPCAAGEQACVQGSFAQCVGGKFALSACAGGTTCQALPLVNKAGTSIACDTAADAAARIAAAKAARRSIERRAAPPATQHANGAAAAALNVKFLTLTAASPCAAGEQACVQGSFAQCVGGKFALSACAGGTTCQALPLVNKAGTSIACDTAADAAARIAAANSA